MLNTRDIKTPHLVTRDRSTITIYDEFELSEKSVLRYYYFTTDADKRRKWVIKYDFDDGSNDFTPITEEAALELWVTRSCKVTAYYDNRLKVYVKEKRYEDGEITVKHLKHNMVLCALTYEIKRPLKDKLRGVIKWLKAVLKS